MTTTSSAEAGLAGLRAQLDLIDATLLDTLKSRIDICVRVAEYKREHDVPMMQPHRIGVVQERAARYGAEHGIDGTFLRRLYDLIITETCRVEDLVIAAEDAPAGTTGGAAAGTSAVATAGASATAGVTADATARDAAS